MEAGPRTRPAPSLRRRDHLGLRIAADIHETAAKGFERGAADYVAGRPSYPDAAIDVLQRDAGLGPGCRAVDLGAGTGLFTRLLVRAEAEVVAVEPVDAMRLQLRAALPDVRVLPGTAEAIPCEDGTADLVTAAQAFHWFEPRVAFAEVHRVLRSGGHVALIWNIRDESVSWVAHLNRMMDELNRGDAPRYRSGPGEWRAATGAHPGFGPVHEARFVNEVPMTLERMRARVASTSYVSALPDAEREAVLLAAERLCRDGPVAEQGEPFIEPYLTELYWARRL